MTKNDIIMETNNQLINGYEYVDLCLPSGLLWAKCNVGAETEDGDGLYFQWGIPKGYTADAAGSLKDGKKPFELEDYEYYNNKVDFSKYGRKDRKANLDTKDDPAHVLMGGEWRMPTMFEYEELLHYTDVFVVNEKGEEIEVKFENGDFTFPPTNGEIKGMKFYKKENRTVYLFFPAAGNLCDGGFYNRNHEGYYLSRTLKLGYEYVFDEPKMTNVFCLLLSSEGSDVDYNDYDNPRYEGLTIKAVSASKKTIHPFADLSDEQLEVMLSIGNKLLFDGMDLTDCYEESQPKMTIQQFTGQMPVLPSTPPSTELMIWSIMAKKHISSLNKDWVDDISIPENLLELIRTVYYLTEEMQLEKDRRERIAEIENTRNGKLDNSEQ